MTVMGKGMTSSITYFRIPGEIADELRAEGVLPPWPIPPCEAGQLIHEWLDQYLDAEWVPPLAQRVIDCTDDVVTVH